MNAKELTARLTAADSNEPSEIYELAGEVLRECREPARTALQLWLHGDAVTAEKARTLLDSLEDLALAPLTQIKTDQPSLQDLVWWMQNVGLAEIELRRQIVRQLGGLLSNKTPIPQRQKLGPAEETDPARRVCDEAYVHLRQLVHLDESQAEYLQNRSIFLNLPDSLKDAEIKKVLQGRQWARVQDEQ